MPCLLLVAFLLLCPSIEASREPGGQSDLTLAKTIHIGWVDISPDDWMSLGYEKKQEWIDLVNGGNEVFQGMCRRLLPRYEVVGAKDRLDDSTGGQGLQVKFTDVRFNVKTYGLHAAIVVIDSRTGAELVKVAQSHYRGGSFSVVSCLNGDFEKLANRVEKEVRRLEKKSKQ